MCGDRVCAAPHSSHLSNISYLEAMSRLKKRSVALKRTVHVTFVPDEEIGGHDGMKMFVKHEVFKKLNAAFALDEGWLSSLREYSCPPG